jgi:hypothetical protein
MMRTGADFGEPWEGKLYRYTLTREWDKSRPPVVFVMLNPSTADAAQDDPTIRRCITFARRWGHGGLVVLNIFALRSTVPVPNLGNHYLGTGMLASNRLAQDKREALVLINETRGRRVVAAWGHHALIYGNWGGSVKPRSRHDWALEQLAGRQIEALALTEDKLPRHPLYLRGGLDPFVYREGDAPAPPRAYPSTGALFG